MKKLLILLFPVILQAQTSSFEQFKGYAFPTQLTASAGGARIAWALEEHGRRNVYVAEGPAFEPKQLTHYTEDDGQEITSLQISADGKWVVFVRGGDHGSNWDGGAVNPTFETEAKKIQVISVPFGGGEVKVLAEGDQPEISPNSETVAFIKTAQVWSVPVNGSSAAKQLFNSHGNSGSIEWSPDGTRLAFVSNRTDHSIIGVYTKGSNTLQWLAPSFNRDISPRWSPDGNRIAFVRMPGQGGKPDSMLVRQKTPWSIWTVSLKDEKPERRWQSPNTLYGSYPSTDGAANLNWAADDRIVFLSYQDGWPHLYSIPAAGGDALLLTPGKFQAEHISLSPDKKWLSFSANAGSDPLDIERRHAVIVSVSAANMKVLTPGTGNEWTPVVLGDGNTVAFLSATAQRPPLPAILSLSGPDKPQLIGESIFSKEYPQNMLVTPTQVIVKAKDGMTVHADLFKKPGTSGKHPAIIYVHGGPPRQMLLGWHYSDYYSNAYASNQYLAQQGFIVLSVNYRLGIGYGFDFHRPPHGGASGAAEYQDVKAAAEWLARQPDVDPARIGIYGGSYGGYLTALALARDSKMFAAGVDIHGVHDWTTQQSAVMANADRYEKAPDYNKALEIAWQSSPVASINTWTSPVLIIHADDDRNVRFTQSTDLVKRLLKKNVPMETMVIVDDTHHWMKHSNAVKVYSAVADYFKRKFKP